MNPGQTPAIEFRDVSISFDDTQALKNISFKLQRGDMICVTGDSESGKSVLLRLGLGFLRPDEGEILINGRATASMVEDELLAMRREAMGMVFQENSFFSGQTVYENAAYRLDDRGWPEDEIERRPRSDYFSFSAAATVFNGIIISVITIFTSSLRSAKTAIASAPSPGTVTQYTKKDRKKTSRSSFLRGGFFVPTGGAQRGLALGPFTNNLD